MSIKCKPAFPLEDTFISAIPDPGTDRSSVKVPKSLESSIDPKTDSSETVLSISLMVTLIDILSSNINVLSSNDERSSFTTIVGGSFTDMTLTFTFNILLS